jgi:type II secretory pathway pseudopilin PulG
VRGVALVLVVAVLALTFLLYTWMERRRAVRRQELEEARRTARAATSGLKAVQREIGVQVTAGYTDFGALAVLVQDHLDVVEEIKRKELT